MYDLVSLEFEIVVGRGCWTRSRRAAAAVCSLFFHGGGSRRALSRWTGVAADAVSWLVAV